MLKIRFQVLMVVTYGMQHKQSVSQLPTSE